MFESGGLFRIPPKHRFKFLVGVVIASLAFGAIISQSASFGAGVGSLSGLYAVAFSPGNEPHAPHAGTLQFSSDETFSFEVTRPNLTGFVVSLRWGDESNSLVYEPSVSVTIRPPVWVREDGSIFDFVTYVAPPEGEPYVVPINEIPENATVRAASPEEAVRLATSNATNATAGDGTWTVTISVGGVPAGRIRPMGSISYDLQTAVGFFEATATRA